MKKCSRCSKPATLHITELNDGNVQELHLCESCAHDYLSNPAAAEAGDEEEEGFSGQLAEAVSEEDLEEAEQLVCENCGITFQEFRKTGRLGCPHDYVAFERELIPLLEHIHGETQHCGKVPKRAPDASKRQYELIKLRNQLRIAIEQEDYEQAAQRRDEIQALESELKQMQKTSGSQ